MRAVLTFDYELFFGDRCGSVVKTILEPTKKILEEIQSVSGRAVFFVDYLMLKRMLEESEETRIEAAKIENQLREIVKLGSRIELHLHPHWIDAKYKGDGQWDFSDYSHYCLGSLPQEEVVKMFVEGADYLNRIARDVNPDYCVRVFRAGGWAVEPCDSIVEGMRQSGINIDSSVCKGYVLNGINYKMDFSHSPEEDIYSFCDEVTKPDERGSYKEVQISSYAFNPITYLLDGIYRKMRRQKFKHHVIGSYMTSGKKTSQERSPLYRRMFRRALFGLDSTSKVAFLFHLILARRSLTVVMGHPKDINDMMLDNIRFLAKFAEFKTYEDVV